MIISYRYPIYPTKELEQKLLASLDTCRWLYNRLLETINKAREEGRPISKNDTQNLIPLLKAENPNLGKVYSKVLQMVNYTLIGQYISLAALKKKGTKSWPSEVQSVWTIQGSELQPIRIQARS